jgi:hypothetical protein
MRASPALRRTRGSVERPPRSQAGVLGRAARPQRAVRRARRGVAMLLRLVFLEGGKRYHLLHKDHPLTAVAPFSERVPMVKGKWDPDASSATAYAWFFWTKFGGVHPAPPIILPIPPGTKTRLAKAEDITFFNGQPSAPLLDGAA